MLKLRREQLEAASGRRNEEGKEQKGGGWMGAFTDEEIKHAKGKRKSRRKTGTGCAR